MAIPHVPTKKRQSNFLSFRNNLRGNDAFARSKIRTQMRGKTTTMLNINVWSEIVNASNDWLSKEKMIKKVGKTAAAVTNRRPSVDERAAALLNS